MEGPQRPAATRPPLSRGGSRRTGGTRSAPERRPPPAPAVPRGPDPLAPEDMLDEEMAPDSWNLRPVLERLKLRRQEISEAAEVVNRVVDQLLRRVRSFKSEFKDVTLLRAGSYYEQVKVSFPAPALLFPRRAGPASSPLSQPSQYNPPPTVAYVPSEVIQIPVL